MIPLIRSFAGVLGAGIFVAWTAGASEPAPGADWPERFAQPPAEFRIHKIIHGWPDAPEAQDRTIRGLQRQGFGGVVCNVSFTEYLQSEPRWAAFTRAVAEARKAGLSLWLYDEKGYPSGTAGGQTLRGHPEWEAAGWLIADARATNGGSVKLDAPPGRLVLAAAYPEAHGELAVEGATNLAGRIQGGALSWQAPAGTWRVLIVTQDRLYAGTHAEMNLAEPIPYLNLMQPEPVERFLELTYGGYARHLGTNLGRYFMSTFTDEPSLMSWFIKPMPWRVLPWAPNLPGEFLKRRGARLDPLLPLLIAEAGPGTAKARHDYWRTVGELVSENFCGQIQARCAQLQIPSGGHLLAEESVTAHVPLYGHFLQCLRRLDAPSIDCLTSLPAEVPWSIARLASAAAELEGRKLVMCESSDHSQHYRPAGDKRPVRPVSEAEIRGSCNRLMVAGVNLFTSYYSFDGLDDEILRRLNDWTGRCCALLREGTHNPDIAVLYPAESLWTRFTPARHWARDSAAAAQIESGFHRVSSELFNAGRDFAYVDGRALAEARPQGGVLGHGAFRWRVVILPWADTLPLAAWENLAEFVRQGGVVAALGRLPANSESEFPSPRVRQLAAMVFGAAAPEAQTPEVKSSAGGGAGVFLPAGSEGLLRGVLDQCLEPDVRIGGESPVRTTHRRAGGREVYFLVNDSPTPWEGAPKFRAAGPAQVWHLETGAIEERSAAAVQAGAALSLPPYGAAFVTFSNARPPRASALAGGFMRNFTPVDIPWAAPETGHGAQVRASLAADPALDTPDRRVWRAGASLLQGGVDTWLFTRFGCPELPEMAGGDLIAVETWVPENQTTPVELLVILHEKDGADYLVSTGRILGRPGRQVVCLPLRQFALAGWSRDANGRLDPGQVTEVRAGWGGYLGSLGEEIRFSIAAPKVLRFQPL